jgi:hypothetical protein
LGVEVQRGQPQAGGRVEHCGEFDPGAVGVLAQVDLGACRGCSFDLGSDFDFRFASGRGPCSGSYGIDARDLGGRRRDAPEGDRDDGCERGQGHGDLYGRRAAVPPVHPVTR